MSLSQIAWFVYDQGKFKERMVATNLVRQLEIDIDKFAGWAFVQPSESARKATPGAAPGV